MVSTERDSQTSRTVRRADYALLLPVLVLISVLPAIVQRPSDFAHYYDAARNWPDIYTLSVPHFFYMPWALATVFPVSVLPLRVAWAVFNVSALGIIWIALRRTCPDCIGRAAAIMRLPFAVLFCLGQWDGWSVAAVLVCDWALQANHPEVLGLALALVIAKPHTVIPIVLIFAARLWRKPPMFRLRALLPAAGVVLLSFAVWGWWVPDYLRFLRLDPPETMEALVTTFGAFPVGLQLSSQVRIGFVIAWLLVLYRLRRHPSFARTAFALVFGVVLWPYTNLYNYVSTAPAIAWLFATHRPLGVVATVAELAAIAVLLTGGPAWLLPLVWLLVGVWVAATEDPSICRGTRSEGGPCLPDMC